MEPDYTTAAAFDVSNYQVLPLRNNITGKCYVETKHQFMAPPGANLQIDWSRDHPKFCNVDPKLIHFKAFRKASKKSRPIAPQIAPQSHPETQNWLFPRELGSSDLNLALGRLSRCDVQNLFSNCFQVNILKMFSM